MGNETVSEFVRFTVGASWIECGLRGVEDYIKEVLGFTNEKEFAAYCFDTDPYSNWFSDSKYTSGEKFERNKQAILNKTYKASGRFLFFTLSLKPEDVSIENKSAANADGYKQRCLNFYVGLFTHLTTIDGWIQTTTVNYKQDGVFRDEEFINLWRLNAGMPALDINKPISAVALSEIPGTRYFHHDFHIRTPVSVDRLKKIKLYLKEYRIRNASEYGSGSDLIDAMSYYKSIVIGKVLKEANYGYISGKDFGVEVGTPLAKVSAGIVASGFYIYDKSNTKERYRVSCYGVSGSLGVSFNFPVNITLSFETFPSAGKVFNGFFQSITNINDFAGRYTVIGANAGVFANVNTALLFVGRSIVNPGLVSPFLGSYSSTILDYTIGNITLAEIFGCRAVISLDGHAFQFLAGAGVSVASGHINITKE